MWALLNPALLMLVLTAVFSTLMRFPIPNFPIFLLSALLPWTFFSQALSYGVESIVGNADLIKKVSVPKLVFPTAAVVGNLINLLLSLIPLALLILLLKHPFHWTWRYLPVPVAALSIFTLGTCFLFTTANVYYRDVSHIIHYPGHPLSLVLPDSDHLLSRLHSCETPVALQAESVDLRYQRVPTVGLLWPVAAATVDCRILRLRSDYVVYWVRIVPALPE